MVPTTSVGAKGEGAKKGSKGGEVEQRGEGGLGPASGLGPGLGPWASLGRRGAKGGEGSEPPACETFTA